MVSIALLTGYVPLYGIQQCSVGIGRGTLSRTFAAANLRRGIGRSRTVAEVRGLKVVPGRIPWFLMSLNMGSDTLHVIFCENAAGMDKGPFCHARAENSQQQADNGDDFLFHGSI